MYVHVCVVLHRHFSQLVRRRTMENVHISMYCTISTPCMANYSMNDPLFDHSMRGLIQERKKTNTERVRGCACISSNAQLAIPSGPQWGCQKIGLNWQENKLNVCFSISSSVEWMNEWMIVTMPQQRYFNNIVKTSLIEISLSTPTCTCVDVELNKFWKCAEVWHQHTWCNNMCDMNDKEFH